MKVRELIERLLDFPMDKDIQITIDEEHCDERGVKLSGYLFNIAKIDYGCGEVLIRFDDYRKEQKNG